MSAADVDVVELGFRFLGNTGFKGPCAYTTDPFIDGLDIPDRLTLGVLLNASEIVKGDDVGSVLHILFPSRHKPKKYLFFSYNLFLFHLHNIDRLIVALMYQHICLLSKHTFCTTSILFRGLHCVLYAF